MHDVIGCEDVWGYANRWVDVYHYEIHISEDKYSMWTIVEKKMICGVKKGAILLW